LRLRRLQNSVRSGFRSGCVCGRLVEGSHICIVDPTGLAVERHDGGWLMEWSNSSIKSSTSVDESDENCSKREGVQASARVASDEVAFIALDAGKRRVGT
jgi:hypothetical protein